MPKRARKASTPVPKISGTGRSRKRRAPPVIDGMQFVDVLLHGQSRARTDAAFRDHLKKKQREAIARGYSPDLYSYLPKPWKGAAGRAQHASKAKNLAETAQQLHRNHPELTHAQIAERMGLRGKPATLQQRIRRCLKKHPTF